MPTRTFLSENGVHACAASLPAFVSSKPWIFFAGAGAADALAKGAKEAGAILWYGMAAEEEIERLASFGAPMIEIIKPYADRDLIYRKIQHAQSLELLAVGIDIDPKAEDIARENASYNGFSAPSFTAMTGNVTEDRALMESINGSTLEDVYMAYLGED